MNLHVQEYLKAVVGALAAALSVLAGAAGDGISSQEWLTTAAAALVAFGAVFGVPNKPPRGRARKAGVSEQAPDAGHAELLWAVVGGVVAVVLLLLFGMLHPR